jgi:hypothetical protein
MQFWLDQFYWHRPQENQSEKFQLQDSEQVSLEFVKKVKK